MPYSVGEDHSACPASKPWAVKKIADGKLMGCHPDKAAAEKHIAAMYANESKAENHKMERRTSLQPVKLETRDGKNVLTGYAAVFYREGDAGTEFQLAPDVRERIAPSAFNRALQQKQDARALFNHDPNMLLGRSSAGTLRLSVDDRGLKYEIDLAETTTGKDVAASVARGDLSGSSFAFRINGKSGQRFEKADGFDVRNVLDVDLYDVGPVTYPAYEGTTTGFRSGDCDDAIEAREQWRQEQQKASDAIAVRCRLISLDTESQMQ